jgi:hypothetical protein
MPSNAITPEPSPMISSKPILPHLPQPRARPCLNRLRPRRPLSRTRERRRRMGADRSRLDGSRGLRQREDRISWTTTPERVRLSFAYTTVHIGQSVTDTKLIRPLLSSSHSHLGRSSKADSGPSRRPQRSERNPADDGLATRTATERLGDEVDEHGSSLLCRP